MRPFRYIPRNRGIHPPAYMPGYKTSAFRSPRLPPLSLQNSLSEVTGPTFGHQDLGSLDHNLIRNYAEDGDPVGERIRVEGIVFYATGAPVRDVLIETWQADAEGRHAHSRGPRAHEVAQGFRGCGRVISDFGTGLWSFDTMKPGRVRGRHGGLMAPHISLWLVARGVNIGLQTRLYFTDEAEANSEDPVLNLIEQAHRRQTLIACREERDGRAVYRLDIRLQGEGETVFLDV